VIILVVFGVVLALPVVVISSITNVRALADTSLHLFTGSASTTNTYDFGYCTFWTAKRREEVGAPIPNNWGDAHTWDDRALLAGYKVDHTPTPYAIMETDNGLLGHVAFVESVDAEGNWTISEMNYKGWDIVDNRTLKPSEAKNYNFIH
jgi:surface antigen